MQPLSLFAGYGIELEYMIVDRDQLNVLPVSDNILKAVAGEYVNEVAPGPIAWSNEVVLHVIELKSNGPAATLHVLPDLFLENIQKINSILDDMNGMLMPGAMHPWMDPYKETRLWPHDASEIYDTYNRIFNCQGHGWSNLQSMHINLPFSGDKEFARLHSAIRLLLPVMPAIAASSPLLGGELTGLMDTRLETYRKNSAIIPSITGLVIPEAVTSRQEYLETILQPMYDDIAPYDPELILRDEWLNSRGAIARFDRSAIEIRVLDTQETPMADLAVASIIVSVLKKLCGNNWADLTQQTGIPTAALAEIFTATIKDAELAVIDNPDYLTLFSFPDRRCEAREFWQYLYESTVNSDTAVNSGMDQALRHIIHHGPLARRISNALRKGNKRTKLIEIYRVLCRCLATGQVFEGIE